MTNQIHEIIAEYVLELCGHELTVYVLDNWESVIKADDFAQFFEQLFECQTNETKTGKT